MSVKWKPEFSKTFCNSIITVLFLVVNALLTAQVNSLSVAEINEFPNYLYMYCLQLIQPGLVTSALALLYYIRHPPLRHGLFREVNDWILCSS